MYFRNTNVALVVFSVASQQSFESAQNWVNQARERVQSQNLKIILVGNKIDLLTRQVNTRQAEVYAEDNGLKYFEVSAKSGTNVKDMFDYVEKLARESLGEWSAEQNKSKI